MQAVKGGSAEALGNIKQEIVAMIGLVKDENLKKLVTESIEKAGSDQIQLSKIQNRLRLKLEV